MTFLDMVLLGIFFGLLGLVLASPTLRASCSVADVNEPRYVVSFPLGYAVLLVYVALAWGFVELLGRMDVDPDAPFGSMHLFGYLIALVIGWVLSSLLYRVVVAPTFLKGFRIAGVQLLLIALAAALASGVLLAALSVWQLLGSPGSSAPASHL